jgi:diacylglycerol kinase family enzyme
VPPIQHTLPADTDRVVISVNPLAGARAAGQRVERLERLLSEQGFAVEVHTDLAQATTQADHWHTAGRLRALVGVGGDGTAAELVNRTSPGVPIAMLPSGTENLLSRHFGVSHSPELLCQTIVDGNAVQIDAGRAGNRIFLLMAGVGFDAAVVHAVHSQRCGHIRKWSYAKPILESMRRYHFPEIRVRLAGEGDDDAFQQPPLKTRWLFAFNLPCYGGGFRVAPDADSSDGLFDVCTYGGGTVWRGLILAMAVYCGRQRKLADFSTLRTPRLRLEADEPVPYQLDGDSGGHLPVELEVLRGRVVLVVPGNEGTTKRPEKKEH